MVDAKLQTVAAIGEVATVDRILEVLDVGSGGQRGNGLPAIRVGPGDDAAVLRSEGDVVVTTDSQHEDIHFRREWIDATTLGRRAIAVTASDLGAMGAAPHGFVVALALPPDTEVRWVERLAGGLREGAQVYGAVIVGGDVACVEGKIGINITGIGNIADEVAPVMRGGARPSDRCWVTGRPGRAAAGRWLMQDGYRPGADPGRDACVDAYTRPEPPVGFGIAAAREGLVTAMMDLSDGLAMDLGRLCRAAGVGVELDPGRLFDDPILERIAAAAAGDLEGWVLSGGDDYELLGAVDPADEKRLLEVAAENSVELRLVGRFGDAEGKLELLRDGRREPFSPDGWDHFS